MIRNGKKIPCKNCGKPVYRCAKRIQQRKNIYCSWDCSNEGRKGVGSSSATEFKRGNIPWNYGIKGVHLSPKTEFKVGEISNEKHTQWQGAEVSYFGLHKWVGNHKERKYMCDWCGWKGITHFANLDYEYTRDLDTWAELCPRCHRNYDKENGWGKVKEIFGDNLNARRRHNAT